MNRSSPSPLSLENVKYAQIFAASLSAPHILVSAQTNEILVQNILSVFLQLKDGELFGNKVSLVILVTMRIFLYFLSTLSRRLDPNTKSRTRNMEDIYLTL